MTLLERTGIEPVGKDALVIGRSNIVGRPMALELLRANATVTVCHSHTRGLAAKARTADILVAAIGRPRFVSGDWVKPGAVVIDVGMNRLATSDSTPPGNEPHGSHQCPEASGR